MLMPKRVKHRKQFRGSMTGKALRGNKIVNGEYGIVAMEPCWIRSNQIEAARIALPRGVCSSLCQGHLLFLSRRSWQALASFRSTFHQSAHVCR